MKWKTFLSGIIAGSVASGISTLLTATLSGKEPRKRLQQNQQSALNQLSELKTNFQELQASAVEAVKEVRTQVPLFISGVKTSVLLWEKDILLQQQEIQRELTEIKNTIQKLEE